jgi:cold shock CspA family protein
MRAFNGGDMRRQGRIVEWNDARGFGFVQWHGGDERAFAHINAFERGVRPCLGDVVTYDVVAGDRGPKAIAIRTPGASPAIRRAAAPRRGWTLHRALRGVITAAVLVVLITAGWRHYAAHQAAQLPALALAPFASPMSIDAPVTRRPAFECTGKQHCSQMSSCEEARFYLAHCPDTKMDGDRDGLPCEDRCR